MRKTPTSRERLASLRIVPVVGRGLVLGLFFLGVTVALAQLTTGTISGTVTDVSGAMVPGATVTVKNADTGSSRNTTTGMTGRYEAPNLPVGRYEVSVSSAGFQTSVRAGIELTVGRNAVVDHQLQVGEVTQQVTVTGEAPLIETTTATVSNVVTAQQIENAPMGGRDLTQLAFTLPGVLKSPAGKGVFGGNGDKIAVAGARGTQNLFLLDGVSNVDLSNNPQGASGSYIGAETIKEFQIVTNNYSAEYQSAAGAIVSAVTKSGTNSLHGSGFWTLRNDNLDAPRWEDNAFAEGQKGEFKRNQFGGSLGGPIIRDRTFFFGSYEGLRERESRTTTTQTLTNEARQGIVPGLAPVQVHRFIVPYLALWPIPGQGNTPLPNEPANPGTIVITGPLNQPTNDDFVAGKFDHQFGSEKLGFLTGTYNFDDSDRSPFGILGDVTENGPSGGNGTISKKHTISVGHTSVLSPTSINEFKFGYSFSEIFGDVPLGTRDTKALAFHPNRDRVGQINITGGPEGVGWRVDFSQYKQKAFQFREGLSLSRGNHSFRLGGELKLFRYLQQSCSRGCNGLWTFRNMRDFLTNVADDFQVFTPGHESPSRNMRQLLFGSYFQDNWQVMPSLTFNLGLRYEFVTVPDEDNHLISNLVNFFDPFVSVTTQVAAQFTKEPRPFVGTIEEYFKNPTLKSFSPRFGFAWAPGDRKTSLRGGYAIFYDYPMLFALRTSLQELPPFVETARLRARGSTAIPANRLPMQLQPQAVTVYNDLLTDPRFSSFNIRYMEFDQSNTYVHRWSLTLQRELGANWMASAGYTGSRGLHLLQQSLPNIRRWDGWPNQPTDRKHFTAGADFLNRAFGEVRTQSSNANSYFHGLAVGVQKRMAQGLDLQMAYNFSKSTDQGSGVTQGGEEFPQGQRGIYYWDLHLKKGLSAFDIRNSFTLNFTYELPTQNLTGVGGALLGGWQTNGIITLTDGHPLSLLDRSTVQEVVIGDDESLRVNLIPGGDNNPVLGGPDKYYDTSQFVPSVCQGDRICRAGETDYQPGYFGTLGAATMTSPGLATVNFSLLKNFKVTENQRLQFRAEFFNLFNRPNFGTPEARVFINEVSNPEAGRIRETRGSARQIQFGLKYIF